VVQLHVVPPGEEIDGRLNIILTSRIQVRVLVAGRYPGAGRSEVRRVRPTGGSRGYGM